jgi:YidC/Oxa1 family membrane protein insertase
MIFMMMPFMFLIFCYNFASGLALYWTVSNVFTVAQTWLMNKLPEPELKKSNKPQKKKSGFFAKLQEQVEAQKTQQKKGSSPAPKKASKKTTSKKKAQNTPQPGQSRTKLSSERGDRHTKSKKRKR